MKSNSFKHACRVSDKLTIYGFKIAKGFLNHFERYTKISKCLFWLYLALLKNQTNKIYENGYFCDFIAVSNKVAKCRFEHKCKTGVKIRLAFRDEKIKNKKKNKKNDRGMQTTLHVEK